MAKMVLTICPHLGIKVPNCIIDDVLTHLLDYFLWIVNYDLTAEPLPVAADAGKCPSRFDIPPELSDHVKLVFYFPFSAVLLPCSFIQV